MAKIILNLLLLLSWTEIQIVSGGRSASAYVDYDETNEAGQLNNRRLQSSNSTANTTVGSNSTTAAITSAPSLAVTSAPTAAPDPCSMPIADAFSPIQTRNTSSHVYVSSYYENCVGSLAVDPQSIQAHITSLLAVFSQY